MHQQPRATEHPLALNKASRSGQRFGVSGWTVSSMEGLRLAPPGDGHRSVRKCKCKPTNTLLGSFPAQYATSQVRSEEHTSELQSLRHLVCRLLLEKKEKHSRT